MKRILFFFVSLLGLVSVLCSIAYTSVTNESLYLQGFQRFSQTAHLGVSYQRYGEYAHALSQYLDGKADAVQVKNPDTGEMESAFSVKENLHLSDVKGIVTGLKIMRYAGGGLVIAVLAALWFLWGRNRRSQLLSQAVRGFAMASLALLLAALTLLIWGLADFTGLFWAFHQIVFSNDLWLLNPQTDLLVALMPEPFFSWYAGEMLKSLWPVLAMMLLILFAWLRVTKIQKEPKTP